MPLEVVILIGLPASGKTTFYQERYAATHEHVSKDAMRNAASKEVRQARQLSAALVQGRSVVVDNTNASRKERAPLVVAARAHGAETIGYFFRTDAAAALRRNRRREGRARVPDVAVFTTRKRLEPPSLAEGFDRLYVVTLREAEGSFEVHPHTA